MVNVFDRGLKLVAPPSNGSLVFLKMEQLGSNPPKLALRGFLPLNLRAARERILFGPKITNF